MHILRAFFGMFSVFNLLVLIPWFFGGPSLDDLHIHM